MDSIIASLTDRIAKYSENLKQLENDIEALCVKGVLPQIFKSKTFPLNEFRLIAVSPSPF